MPSPSPAGAGAREALRGLAPPSKPTVGCHSRPDHKQDRRGLPGTVVHAIGNCVSVGSEPPTVTGDRAALQLVLRGRAVRRTGGVCRARAVVAERAGDLEGLDHLRDHGFPAHVLERPVPVENHAPINASTARPKNSSACFGWLIVKYTTATTISTAAATRARIVRGWMRKGVLVSGTGRL